MLAREVLQRLAEVRNPRKVVVTSKKETRVMVRCSAVKIASFNNLRAKTKFWDPR